MPRRRARVVESALPPHGPAHGTGRADGGERGCPPGSPPARPVPVSLRGRVRLGLIRDLAMGEWSYSEISDQTGIPTADIAAFAEEERDAIVEVKSALAGKLAIESSGLWISKKQNRVAELQALFGDNEDVISYLRSLGVEDGKGLGSRRHTNLARTQLAILGAVANEYEPRRGTPTARDDPDRKVVHYIIEGLDPESLT